MSWMRSRSRRRANDATGGLDEEGKQRACRYIHLDAGHIGQRVATAAVALGLGSCRIAALYDEEVNELLGVDGIGESEIYLTVEGNPSK